MPRTPFIAWRRVPRAALLAFAACACMAAAPEAPDKPLARPATQQPGKQPGPDAARAPKEGPEAKGTAPSTGGQDPVVASVEGHPIHLSDLGRATQGLPPNLRDLPFETLYPVLLDRMVDHEALVMLARRRGLEDQPAVKREIEAATERVLEGALLALEAKPKVTEQAIKARYDQLYAHQPATEEVRARHILVTTEAEAKAIITELRNGADFATLAKERSKDPDGARGGELGFFRREQVWPGFADAAFALQPGQVADKPIHNEFGWHVIKVEERRLVAPPSYADIHDQLREELTQAAVKEVIAEARRQMTIHRWNLDGSPIDDAAKAAPLVRSGK